jgi:curved DNA-binding protein CbpA
VNTLPPEQLEAWTAMLENQSYYEILGVPQDANPAAIKAAFHELALQVHPDNYVEEEPEVGAVASEVFKRGVEAYKVLSKPRTRSLYDEGLAKGKLRYVEGEIEEAPPPLPTRTLEEIATTPRAKQFGLKADRLIALGKLDEARVALITALQDDFDNEELKDRLTLLYEAIALEEM